MFQTLRDGSTNLFAVRRNKNPAVCPIKVIDLYAAFAKGIGVDLTTSPGGEAVDKASSYYAADSPFQAYLDESPLTPAGTLHDFRSGCAIALALTVADMQSIMEHVGWRRQSTASYYMQLSKVMSANSPSL